MRIFLLRLGPQVDWKVQRDGDAWVAICETFRLIASGETYSALTSAIRETMGTMFESLTVSGELPMFLKEAGWDSPHVLKSFDREALKTVGLNTRVKLFEVTISQN